MAGPAHAETNGGPEAPVNVLFLMIQMEMGGAERLVLDLARSLDRRHFTPSVAWLLGDSPLDAFSDLGIPLYHVPKTKRVDWRAALRLRRLVLDHDIAVVNAHHFMPLFYAYCATKLTRRASLVYTEHSTADVLGVSGPWKAVGACMLAGVDGVVGVSHDVSRALAGHFHLPPSKIHTIENGVDLDCFGHGGDRREALRAALGVPAQNTLVGIVANLRRNKNHLFLLEAFRRVHEVRRDVTLALVGQAFDDDRESSADDVAAFVRDHGLEDAVRCMGYRDDVSGLLQAMDVFCLVSYKEGLPISVMEAMAVGLPIIGTDIEGLREVIEPGVNGLTVRPDDVPALVHALDCLISDVDLRRRMAAASRRIAAEKYSLHRCVGQTAGLLTAVTRHRRGRPCALNG